MATANTEKAPPAQTGKLLTVREIADALRVHPRTVKRWQLSGLLRATKLGPRCVRFAPEAVREFVARSNGEG